ncbi:hypothetical protein BC835DRAFT_1421402 [Cytidiella melzeri]|nr:hypothetical protein BC835DRAFT_1421402 [Cytidiella melzeri]
MSTTPIDVPVLIVGGGPSGLVLALSLVQNGIAVRIIDKNPNFHVGQRGSGIQPRSLELFKFLGVLPDIWEQSAWNKPSAIYQMPEGRDIAKVVDMTPYAEPTPDVPFDNLIRKRFYANTLRNEEGVTAQVVRRLDTQEEIQIVRAKHLVSAEGAKSVVRKQLAIPFIGETKDSMRLVHADIYASGISTEYWHQWGDMGSKTVRIRPTEYPGIFSLMAGGKDADTATLAASRDALLKFVYKVTNRSPEELQFGEIKSVSEFRPNIRLADKFSEGRVFLVGDAAHVHSPTGGQGLNTGIQDSFNLAWKLALVLKHQSPPSLLTSYTFERLPVAKDVLSLTTKIMEKTVAFKTGGGTDASFAQRPKALHQLGVNHRRSDIVVDEQPDEKQQDEMFDVSAAYRPEDPSVLRAGDRAPDSPGLLRLNLVLDRNNDKLVSEEESTTLFDILSTTRHTALIFPSAAAADVRGQDITETVMALKCATPRGTIHIVFILINIKDCDTNVKFALDGVADRDIDVFVDGEGHAHAFYPPVKQGFSTIIVRPDAVVGAVVKSREGVEEYLNRVFCYNIRGKRGLIFRR